MSEAKQKKAITGAVERTKRKSWDTPEWRQERNQRLMGWFCENKDAVVCMVLISSIVEIWDDLIDKDKDLNDNKINMAFMQALIDLPSNSFWKQYQPLLQPVMLVSINAWMDATEAEKSDECWKRRMAFYLRNLSMELVLQIAQITGGWDHLRKVSMDIRTFFAHEDYEQWEYCNENKPSTKSN